MATDLCEKFERAIRRDPGRGLLAGENDHWRSGSLAPAAQSLVNCRTVGIMTGFAIPMPDGPVAETDGPPGAVLLADVLQGLGRCVLLITDEPCRSAVRSAAVSAGLGDLPILASPVDPRLAEDWITDVLKRHQDLSHLVSIERVGPSHTVRSLTAPAGVTSATCQDFEKRVPSEHRDSCHNMRGEIIDAFTAPLHRLLERAAELPHPPQTIGIGDGGNEIGMGGIPWQELADRIQTAEAAWTFCRIPTTWTILCGVSNWGAMALAAAVSVLADRPELILAWTESRQLKVLRELVDLGPAVDGSTRRAELTVDGLPPEEYFQPWRVIERTIRSSPDASRNAARTHDAAASS
jgi:hypothetical protein